MTSRFKGTRCTSRSFTTDGATPRSLPFDKWVTARIVANELRAIFETPAEAGGRGVTGAPPSGATGTTLIGPIAIDATKGNDSRPNR